VSNSPPWTGQDGEPMPQVRCESCGRSIPAPLRLCFDCYVRDVWLRWRPYDPERRRLGPRPGA